MRGKIILVNGGIVLILSLITFFLLRTSLQTAVADPRFLRGELSRTLGAAEARLTLDALLAERWLDRQSALDSVVSVFEGGTPDARADSATAAANRLRDQAVAGGEFAKMSPSLVLFVDREGVGMGRNGSELMRGDLLAQVYPDLKEALATGHTGSALWANEQRQEQFLASYAPVRNKVNEIVGALVIGTGLHDERLTLLVDQSSRHKIALRIGGRTIAVGGGRSEAFTQQPVEDASTRAQVGKVTQVPGSYAGQFMGTIGLSSFPGAVLVGAVPVSLIASIDAVLWPVFAVALLGLFLVVTGGFLLGNYISRPIGEIEEGLLLIINGQQDLRFDLEHDELGGLTSRINSLLNSLLGVKESDEES